MAGLAGSRPTTLPPIAMPTSSAPATRYASSKSTLALLYPARRGT